MDGGGEHDPEYGRDDFAAVAASCQLACFAAERRGYRLKLAKVMHAETPLIRNNPVMPMARPA